LLGEEYNFYFGPGYDWYAKVIKAKEGKSFHMKMTKSDEDWNPTSFGFDFENKSEKALLKFWHNGWPECNAHYRHSSFCWAIWLKALKDYIENDIVIPFEERS